MSNPTIGLILLCVAVSGCQAPDPRDQIEGEWIMHLLTQDTALGVTTPGEVGGVFVFDRNLPCYCEEDVQAEPYTVGGRGYLNYMALGSQESSSNQQYFNTGISADMLEEMVATVKPSGQVMIGGVGSPVQVNGVVNGDSIHGHWLFMSHADTVGQGLFSMSRRGATYYSDSAVVRSRRGVRRWKTSEPVPTEGPADTAEVVAPLNPAP